jgi:hypothetical protein
VAGVAVGVAVLQVIDSACCLTLYFHSWLSTITQEIMNASFVRPANFTRIYLLSWLSGQPSALYQGIPVLDSMSNLSVLLT